MPCISNCLGLGELYKRANCIPTGGGFDFVRPGNEKVNSIVLSAGLNFLSEYLTFIILSGHLLDI